jgi:hypothetical protein
MDEKLLLKLLLSRKDMNMEEENSVPGGRKRLV